MITVHKLVGIVIVTPVLLLAGCRDTSGLTVGVDSPGTPSATVVTSTTTTTTTATTTTTTTVAVSAASEPEIAVAPSDLQVIDFFSRATGVALTDSAFASVPPASHRPMRLAITTDGGEHWRTEGVALPRSFWRAATATIAFESAKVGFVDSGVALVGTVDGGLQWNPIRLGDEVTEVSLVGSSAWAVVIGCPATAPTTPHCPAAVASAEVGLHGAGTWQVHSLAVRAIPGSQPTMARPSAAVGVLTGLLWPDDKRNPLLVTEDGGTVWRNDGAPCASGDWTGPGAVAAVSSTLGKSDWWLVCGGGGPGMGMETKAIERSGNRGATWTQIAAFTSPSPYRNRGNLPTGDAGPLAATSPLRLWFLTANYLSTSSDGGRQWTTLPGVALHGGGEFATLSFVEPSHGWLVAPGVGLWRTVNGSRWTQLKG